MMVHAHSAAVERNEEELRELIRSEFRRYCSLKRSKCHSVCKKEGKTYIYTLLFTKRNTGKIFQKTIKLLIYKRWGEWMKGIWEGGTHL